VSEDNGAGALALGIGANSSTVFDGERNGLLCGRERGKAEGEGHGAKDGHAAIIQRASHDAMLYPRTLVSTPKKFALAGHLLKAFQILNDMTDMQLKRANAINVLIVDDSVAIRMMLQRMLGQAGFDLGHVMEARDGIEALRMLDTQPVELILSDINMPNMDGLKLLTTLKSNANLKHVPVVMITSEVREEQVLEALRLGAGGYLRKPFAVYQLRKLLRLFSA
jgi:two-component system chemotaxis response regulator CheY